MRVLIAEDDTTSRNILTTFLKKWGYDPVTANTGKAALEVLYQPGAPRLAILDWMMPEMDGLEVVRRVRAQEAPNPPYIIMLTAKTGKDEVIVGLEAGADDYLAKPFDPGELRARVEVGRRLIEMQAALFASRETLAHEATHDPLTGMLNRRAILERLDQELSRAHRHGDALAVGICDLDHFKQVNDTYGHQTGDEVLIGCAQILNENIRDYDSVGRLGGEEFLVVVPMQAGVDLASSFDRLRACLAASNISTRSGTLTVTVSIGVAAAAAGSTVDEILEAADAALYRAKHEGRNRVVYERRCSPEGSDLCAS
jgi:two-component system cell cycle response regulator